MTLSFSRPVQSLQSSLRPVPPLDPDDSLERLIRFVRHLPVVEIPIVKSGRLCGVVDYHDLVKTLGELTESNRVEILSRPIRSLIHPPAVVARADCSPQELAELFSENGATAIPVLDDQDYCLGMVVATDLLVPEGPPHYPGPVGGMATPFGVYLTNGNLRAGVGDAALFASGAWMGCLFLIATGVIQVLSSFAVQYLHAPDLAAIDLDGDTLIHPSWTLLGAFLCQVVTMILFLLLMRSSRVAGYHAAEHQAVHAMERSERLEPGIVARMPRAHPRCGTNLWAAGMVYGFLLQMGRYVFSLGIGTAGLLAAFGAVLLWRRVGHWLQETFTTRPATERELASGITAANGLISKYLHGPPARIRRFRKLWCAGLIQTAAGMLCVMGLVEGLSYLWHGLAH